MKDAWLSTDPPRPAYSEQENNEILVSELIKCQGRHRSWDEKRLDAEVTEEDRNHVRRIYLAQEEDE